MYLSLPAEHVEALHSVDLQFFLGVHGKHEDLGSYGPATLGVDERDYTTLTSAVNKLDKERGDRLASEGIGSGQLSPLSVVNGSIYYADHSPYLDKPAAPILEDSLQNPPGTDAQPLNRFFHVNRGALQSLLSEMQDFRILSPFDHGLGHAVSQGIPLKSLM